MTSYITRRLARLGDAVSPEVHPDPPRALHDGPSDFIALATIHSAQGLHGHVRAKSFFPGDPKESVLLEAKRVWLRLPRGGWLRPSIDSISVQAQGFRMKFAEVDHRAQAEHLLFAEVGLSRGELPAAKEDEVYWADLIGLAVFNAAGQALGTVDRLETNGEHDWLIVGPHWIPFVKSYVHAVNLEAGRIDVDWEPDWT